MQDQPGYGDSDTQIVIRCTVTAWYSFVLCDARMVRGLSLPASGLHFFDQEVLNSLDNPTSPSDHGSELTAFGERGVTVFCGCDWSTTARNSPAV